MTSVISDRPHRSKLMTVGSSEIPCAMGLVTCVGFTGGNGNVEPWCR